MGNKRKPYERPDTTMVKVSEEHFLAGSFRGTLNPYNEGNLGETGSGTIIGNLQSYSEGNLGETGSGTIIGNLPEYGEGTDVSYGEGEGW